MTSGGVWTCAGKPRKNSAADSPGIKNKSASTAAAPVPDVDGERGEMLAFRKLFCGGAVAQLGARLDGIEEVVGSNPIGSTN
jgi:hypothetical protein